MMDIPVCVSQNFINKQNVRCYKNIYNTKLLKNQDSSPFLQDVFEDRTLVSELTDKLRKILTIIKDNLRKKLKEDFRNYFSTIKRPDILRPVGKIEIFTCCMKALNEIVPRSFYGGDRNAKLFKRIVQTVIFSMKRQHIMLSKVIGQWDFSSSPWNIGNEDTSGKFLYAILLWILKNILSPMICLNFYVTTCKLDADENKLHFFWKSQWQSFYDKKISNMLFTKVLQRSNIYCVTKKMRKNYSLTQKSNLKSIKKDIPKLHLVLKTNRECRPIVRYKSVQNTTEKYKMKERLHFLKSLTGKPNEKIEIQFNSIYQKWLSMGCPKLYFVKTDLSNAFGCINKEKLLKILNERHNRLQNAEKSLPIKQKMARLYKEFVSELRQPLLVRSGNSIYEWTEGLVQGYKYSPALSELYYTHLDEIYFVQHLKNPEESQIKLFVRVVDDYLYVTNSLDDAHLFLEALSKYRNVNYEKTVVNFKHEIIRFSEVITFLGYSYNTNTLQVSRASNVFVGQMCYKIAFTSAVENMNKFLENRIGQSGIQISGHIFNFHHNTEDLVWKHVFTTFSLSANKFCTILAVSCEEYEMVKYMDLYKQRVTVKLTNSIIDTLLKNKPADFMFMYCINHFRYLSFKALYLCAKGTPKCSGLVPLINDEMAKSNCLFGKWNEHYCRIESDGKMRRPAVKQVCRRTDLRKIMKDFEKLPSGFQCYNHKMM